MDSRSQTRLAISGCISDIVSDAFLYLHRWHRIRFDLMFVNDLFEQLAAFLDSFQSSVDRATLCCVAWKVFSGYGLAVVHVV